VADARLLAVTLLRCVGLISAEVLATRPWDVGPQTPTPDAQMMGETVFSLGLWADAPDDPADLLAGWERFGLPLAEAPAAGCCTLPRSGELLSINQARHSSRAPAVTAVRRRSGCGTRTEIGRPPPALAM